MNIQLLELTLAEYNNGLAAMVKFSITEKLILYVILISVVTSATVSIVSYFDAKDALISRTLEQLTSVKVVKSRQIQNYFEDRKSELNMFAHLLLDVDLRDSEKLINDFIKHNKKIKDIKVTPVSNIEKELGETYIYEVKENKILNLHIAKTLEFKEDTLLFDMLIDYSVINAVMLENSPNSGLGNSGESYIVGHDKLLRTTSRFKKNSILKIEVSTEGVGNALMGIDSTGLFDDYRGVTVFSSYGKMNIDGLDWCILAEIDYHEAIQSINDIRNKIIFSTVMLALIIFIVVFIFSKNITRPILELQKSAAKIGKGILTNINIKHSNDEIGDLVNSFNAMIEEIKSANRELEEERHHRNTTRLEAEENERERLSKELHDGLGQTLTALKLQIESFDYSDLSEESANKLKLLSTSVDWAVDDIRRISNNLMPSVLKEFGIAASLRYLVETINVNQKLEIHFESDKLPFSLSKHPKINIYRIVQEALNNSIKHSGTDKIYLSMKYQNDILRISIKDNGRGFEHDKVAIANHNGLVNMKERADSIGADLEIQAKPNVGTTILLAIKEEFLHGED